MELIRVLACLSSLVCVASVSLTPRGARPVEPGTRSEKCASQKEWPFCTDDDWGRKCPSGCRIQGLMDKYDHSLLKRIEKIRSILDQNKVRHRSTDLVSKQTFDILKEKLTTDAGFDNNYYDLAQKLRQRITELKMKIDRQLGALASMKDRVKDQVVEMQRMEVDIDIKLRSCKGSCSRYSEHQVDRESYVSLDKQINQLDAQSAQNLVSTETLYVMKSRPLREKLVESIYKSGITSSTDQTEDAFPEIKNIHLVLEAEGSPASPATITKDPGTSYSASTSSSSSSSASSSSSSSSSSPSSKSITEAGLDSTLFGTGFGGNSQPSTSHMSTKTVTCTKSIRRTVVQTKDGPVENVEEVMDGGPECQVMTDSTKSGMTSFFPTISQASSSSGSSITTKTVHASSAKGSTSGSTDFMDIFGADIQGFLTDRPEEDVPDLHARSVKTTRVERQADYVGKVCLRLKQQKQDGRQPVSQTQRSRKQQCRAESDVALCSDDDWVSKCPSGCRLQGLISEMESEAEKKLRKVCKMAKWCEDAAETSMAAMTQIYNSNRRVIVHRYVSELRFVEDAEKLSRTLASLRKRWTSLTQQLKELHGAARKQVEDLYRTEVDIDMNLRACGGSCRSALPFAVDHPSYQTLQTDLDQVEAVTPPEFTARVLMRTVDVHPAPSAEYKRLPAVQRNLLTQFEDVGQNELVLEELLEPADVGVLELSDLQ